MIPDKPFRELSFSSWFLGVSAIQMRVETTLYLENKIHMFTYITQIIYLVVK